MNSAGRPPPKSLFAPGGPPYTRRVIPRPLPALAATLLLALTLTGCLPRAAVLGAPEAPYTGTLTPRPPGTPDVVIFAVSGRCRFPCLEAPNGNWDYLGPRGAVNEVAEAFRDLGFRVETHAYSAHLLATHRSPISGKDEAGFVQLDEDFRRVRDELVAGRTNPTRIVLLAHSHGTNWTHQLARLHPSTPIDLMIDLDGICALWESDNRRTFRRFYEERGGSPWPLDVSRACDVTFIGRRAYRPKDLVYPNVRYDLEVQSRRVGGATVDSPGPNLLFDSTVNIRPDGTRDGIETLVARVEDHGEITYAGSEALRWVASRIRALPWGTSAGPS